MRPLLVLLSVSLSIFVFVVQGADTNRSQPDNDVTKLLDRASMLRNNFAASLTKVIYVAGDSTTFLVAQVEKRLQELDMTINNFDKKCDIVVEILEGNLNKAMKSFPDLSKESESSESEVLAKFSLIFEETVKVLNKESDALQGELKAQGQELTDFGITSIKLRKKAVYGLLTRESFVGKIRKLYSQYRKSKKPLVVILNLYKHDIPNLQEVLQSMDERRIFRKSFGSVFDLAWKSWAKRVEQLNDSSSKWQQNVTEYKRLQSQSSRDHEAALTSFRKCISECCLPISATGFEQLISANEKLLRDCIQLNKNNYMVRINGEILLAKAQARLSCEECKTSVLTNCFDSSFESDEGTAQ